MLDMVFLNIEEKKILKKIGNNICAIVLLTVSNRFILVNNLVCVFGRMYVRKVTAIFKLNVVFVCLFEMANQFIVEVSIDCSDCECQKIV